MAHGLCLKSTFCTPVGVLSHGVLSHRVVGVFQHPQLSVFLIEQGVLVVTCKCVVCAWPFDALFELVCLESPHSSLICQLCAVTLWVVVHCLLLLLCTQKRPWELLQTVSPGAAAIFQLKSTLQSLSSLTTHTQQAAMARRIYTHAARAEAASGCIHVHRPLNKQQHKHTLPLIINITA